MNPTLVLSPAYGPAESPRDSGPILGLPRGRRVIYLLTAIVLMSLADLAITLEWVTQVGLAESNPIARWIIAQGSITLLTVWKLVTIVPAVVVFAALRDRPVAEVGSLIAFGVMATVMLHWFSYQGDLHTLTMALPAFEQGADHRWIVLASN